MMSPQETMNKAKQMAANNLRKCAIELVEYRDSAVLVDGHVRQIATLLQNVDANNSLTLAQSIITNLCIEQVAETQVKP